MVKVCQQMGFKYMDNLGWVDVYGNFYNCKFGDHYRLAIELCRGYHYKYYPENDECQDDPESSLFKHGFCKIGLNFDNETCVYHSDNGMTALQKCYIESLVANKFLKEENIEIIIL